MGYLSVNFKENFLKSFNEIKLQSPKRNKVDTYGRPVYAPDKSATLLTAKICTSSNEHSMYIRFLCNQPISL